MIVSGVSVMLNGSRFVGIPAGFATAIWAVPPAVSCSLGIVTVTWFAETAVGVRTVVKAPFVNHTVDSGCSWFPDIVTVVAAALTGALEGVTSEIELPELAPADAYKA